METMLIILGIILFILTIKINIFENFFDSAITEFPWWNSTRRTRNMNYDLRGDPLIIPKHNYFWNNIY